MKYKVNNVIIEAPTVWDAAERYRLKKLPFHTMMAGKLFPPQTIDGQLQQKTLFTAIRGMVAEHIWVTKDQFV